MDKLQVIIIDDDITTLLREFGTVLIIKIAVY